MSRSLASLFIAAALFAAGGLLGAAISPGRDPAQSQTATASPQPPVEVRTVVKRRTVHVYRKPKRRHVAPPPTAAPAPVAPAPVRATAPVTPAPASAPLVTRTSGSAGAGHGDDEGDDETEHGDD